MEALITTRALNDILGDKAANSMLDDNAIEFFLRNLHEIGLSSQRREMLLFMSSNLAAVTSRANQQYHEHLLTKTPSKEVQQSINTQAMNTIPSFLTHLLLNMQYVQKTTTFPKMLLHLRC